MTDHEHPCCATCGRMTAACPECAQVWPQGTPGRSAKSFWLVMRCFEGWDAGLAWIFHRGDGFVS